LGGLVLEKEEIIDSIPLKIKEAIKRLNWAEIKREQRRKKKEISIKRDVFEKIIPDKKYE